MKERERDEQRSKYYLI